MCFECHQNIPNEKVITSLNTIINDPSDTQFEDWNTTSVSHIIQVSIGVNGDEARMLAINVLKKFIKWRYTQPVNYLPKNSLELMYNVKDIENDLNYAGSYSPDYTNKEKIIKDYAKYKKSTKRGWGCNVH